MAIPTLGAMIAAMGSPAEWGAVDTTKLYWDNVNSRLGIGITPTGAKLEVYGGLGSVAGQFTGQVNIMGTNCNNHFNFSTAENTYIRRGKTGATVYINDSHNGNVRIAEGGGRVGINCDPSYYLHAIGNGTYAYTGVFYNQGTNADINALGAQASQYNTADGTKFAIGLSVSVDSRVQWNTTNSGYQMGIDNNMLRYDQSGNLDTGTLSARYNMRVLIGHYGSEGTKTTTSVYGIYSVIYHTTGTINSYYGLYLADGGGASSIGTKFHIWTDDYGLCYYGNLSHWYYSSDQKIKKNITAFSGGTELIKQLKIRTFQYNGNAGLQDDGVEHLGLIADEVEGVFPEIIKKTTHYTRIDPKLQEELRQQGKEYPLDKDHGEEYRGFHLDKINFALISAVQEIEERVTKLEKPI